MKLLIQNYKEYRLSLIDFINVVLRCFAFLNNNTFHISSSTLFFLLIY